MNDIEKIEQQPVESQDQTPTESQQEVDWRRYREEKEKQRQQLIESKRREEEERKKAESYKAMIEAMTASKQEQQQEEESEEQKYQRWYAKQKQKEEEDRKQNEQREFPTQLRRSYPDFDRVCSSENIDYLEYHHKEIADVLNQLPEGFDKWSKVYHLVKKMVPEKDVRKEQQRIEKNSSKPQAFASQVTPGTDSKPLMQLSDAKKAENWARMVRLMKSV